MAATPGDQGHSKAGMDVINTGDLLWGSIWAAPFLIRGVIVVHHQFFYLHKALDDGNHPKVCLWHLDNSGR